jgi:hypothetical protein
MHQAFSWAGFTLCHPGVPNYHSTVLFTTVRPSVCSSVRSFVCSFINSSVYTSFVCPFFLSICCQAAKNIQRVCKMELQ